MVSLRWLFVLVMGVLVGSFAASADTTALNGNALDEKALNENASAGAFFREAVAPLLSRSCLGCHNETKAKGGLSLATRAAALRGGQGGRAVVPGKPAQSSLLRRLRADGGETVMPKDGEPLSDAEVAILRRWLENGASWPEGVVLAEPVADLDWWSLRPLARAEPPLVQGAEWARNPIDLFVSKAHETMGLSPSPEASRVTLFRRVYFDLLGMAPAPEAVRSFLVDDDPLAYEKLVDRLLASPRYGERWARHWLDVVHYADTHGYDKDKPRPNAWPYRDYVIRAFNADKPYDRFVREQIAGDVLYPGTTDGILALGFISAGPWDYIGHDEVPETKIDGQVARNLDRDDMVTVTMNVFSSTTVQCARCHNHKFDPVKQEHYYSLQAVFAAVDRADRAYDEDPTIAARRLVLEGEKDELSDQARDVARRIESTKTEELRAVEAKLAEPLPGDRVLTEIAGVARADGYGFHSVLEKRDDAADKWVEVDLGSEKPLDQVLLFPAAEWGWNDFGFPMRFRLEASVDRKYEGQQIVLLDHTAKDVVRPGVRPLVIDGGGQTARYVRLTATKLWGRRQFGKPGNAKFMFALGELAVLSGGELSSTRRARSADTIEARPRWGKSFVTDGIYGRYSLEQLATALGLPHATPAEQAAVLLRLAPDESARARLAKLGADRERLLEAAIEPQLRAEKARLAAELARNAAALRELPPQSRVYAGTVHKGAGNFVGRYGLGPRKIHVLVRGEVTQPGDEVGPGTVPLVNGVDWRFELPEGHGEGDRRVALASWLTRDDHPLAWRSIANRLWYYHFGRGLVDSPNDFGRMGQKPTHPALLDWLATSLRDGDERSLKRFHRRIITSGVYRQSSAHDDANAAIDSGNRYLWRMNRRKLDAEALRDSTLLVSGKLNTKMYGPGFRDFVLEKPQHSPHYEYHKHDPEDVSCHRRSVYRFLARSQQEPFMETLDCADPSQIVAKRNQTLTSLQALALLNNKLVLAMAKHFAARLEGESNEIGAQIERGYWLSVGRAPTPEEAAGLVSYAREHGLPNACRVLLNLNEFAFVD